MINVVNLAFLEMCEDVLLMCVNELQDACFSYQECEAWKFCVLSFFLYFEHLMHHIGL